MKLGDQKGELSCPTWDINHRKDQIVNQRPHRKGGRCVSYTNRPPSELIRREILITPELLFSSGLAFRAPPPYSPFFSLMFLFFVKLACSFAVATCPRLQFSAVCKSVLLVK